MALPIISLKDHALNRWTHASRVEGGWNESFSPGQQACREEELDCLLHDIDGGHNAGRSAPNERILRLISVRSRVQKSVVQLLHSFGCVIDDEMEGSFSEVTDRFIR